MRTIHQRPVMALGLVAAAALAGAVGCEEKKTPPPPAPKTTSAVPAIPGVSPDATKAIGDAAADARTKMVTALESGLNAAKTKIDELAKKTDAAAADKKPEMQAALDKLKADYAVAEKEL